MTTTEARPLLELRGLYKSFGAVQVLHDVDLTVRAGEVTALVGDNGAGKSTLVKCVSGIYAADSGEFRFDGRPVSIHSPRDAATLGIEVVYQDLALCDNLDIVQNMFLGREALRGFVLDEPTAALGVAQTAQVLELVRRLADNGLAVLLISHNMNDVFAVSDSVAALYLGRMVAQVKASDVTHGQVVELITAGRSGNLGLPPQADTNGGNGVNGIHIDNGVQVAAGDPGGAVGRDVIANGPPNETNGVDR